MPGLDGVELARFENGSVLLAARVGRPQVERGESTSLQLAWAWRGEGDPGDLSVWVVAGDADGGLIEAEGGAPLLDHRHPLGQGIPVEPDATRTPWLESVAFVLPRGLPAGQTALFAALSRDGSLVPTDDERVFVRIGTIDVAPRTRSAWQIAPGDASPDQSGAAERIAEGRARR